MRDEHCGKPGHNTEFTTSMYSITTTPELEWRVIVEGETCPSDHIIDPRSKKVVRRIPSIDELLQMEKSVAAGLTREEVIAVVLYTGPMFKLYNSVLRRVGDANNFTTTIFVLVSAIKKLTRIERIPEGTTLYRGLGGLAELPKQFTSGDTSDGLRGYAEWGFMSTTADKTVAIRYSGIADRRPKAMVMAIEPNAVDRGANVVDYSQYPQEKEYLWVPCSFVQPMGDGVPEILPEGVVTVVEVRVNANLKGDTVEELRGRKKHMHVTAFASLIEDTR